MSDSFPARRLQSLLREQIPLAREMAVDVCSWGDDGLEVTAPLGPNVNHHGTFFGGSAAALGILAGWSLVHLLALEDGLEADIVIQRVAVRYTEPAPGPIVARALHPDPATWRRFGAGYRRNGMARLRVRVRLMCEDRLVATLDAAYAATARESP
ncbi:MAG: YiiD C-terminal domain-containing protein [Longimicrobiales bacterium]